MKRRQPLRRPSSGPGPQAQHVVSLCVPSLRHVPQPHKSSGLSVQREDSGPESAGRGSPVQTVAAALEPP